MRGGEASGNGGISDAGGRPVDEASKLWPRPRWKDDTDGFVDSGGDGKLGRRGEVRGVCVPDGESASATVGDCRGDWYGTS